MRLKILVILFLVLFSCFCFDSALAIGIGAKPSFLNLELKVGQPKQTKILVYNLSQESGIFQISPDELNKEIKVEPSNFRLEAGENKKVKITILPKEEGIKAINLSVSANSLDRQSFSVGPGLKIPLRLNIEKRKSTFLASLLEAISQNWIWVTGILVVFLIRFSLAKYLKKRKKIAAPPENLPIEISSEQKE